MNDFIQASPPCGLLIKHLLERSLVWAPERTIHYRELKQLTYRAFFERVQRAAHLLGRLGVGPGDRVGVMDLDSHRYLELFFAVPMVGAILHTVNVRLSTEQTQYTIDHAGDKLLFLHEDFIPLAGPLLPRLPHLKKIVLLSDRAACAVPDFAHEGEYETLLAGCPGSFSFPDFDENTVATLFYTTGTTGDPKGVFFTHRQLVLHTLSVGLTVSATPKPFQISSDDVYMPLTPLFHVHGWGIPYIATLLGQKQIYAGRYEPERFLRLIQEHGVTLTHGVPTIVQTLLHHPASRGVDLSRLKILVGGSALPEGLAQEAMDRGIQIMAAYGMSETCPVVTASYLQPGMEHLDPAARRNVLVRAGQALPLVRTRVVDPDGNPLPPGPEHTGELVLQAPWLTAGYYRNEERSRDLWRGGWLHTGDVAYVDAEGYVRITDRLKDVIKIGGEWISSLELENALSRHEAVRETAVVAQPDPHWGERPYAEVVLRPDKSGTVTAKDLVHFLRQLSEDGLIHKRAILTHIQLVDALPRTSVGKLDKKTIRRRLKE